MNYKKQCTYPIRNCNECIYQKLDILDGLIYCEEILNIIYKTDKTDEADIIHDLIDKARTLTIPEWCRLEDYKEKKYESDFDKYIKGE